MWVFLKHISSTGNLSNTVSLNGNDKRSVKHYTERTLQSVNTLPVHLGMSICYICLPRRWWGCLVFQLHVGSISAGVQGVAELHRVMRALAKDLPGSCCCDHTVSHPIHCDGLPQICTPHPSLCILSSQACTVLLEGVPGGSRGSVLSRAVHPSLCVLPGQNPPGAPTMGQISLDQLALQKVRLTSPTWGSTSFRELFLPWVILFVGLTVQVFLWTAACTINSYNRDFSICWNWVSRYRLNFNQHLGESLKMMFIICFLFKNMLNWLPLCQQAKAYFSRLV